MTDSANRLFRLLREMVQCCQEGESLQAKVHNLSVGESRALIALRSDNCRTTADLAQQLGVAKSRVTRIVDMLAEKRLVLRSQNDGDRRLCLIRLTPTGGTVADDLINSIMSLHSEVINSLPTGIRAEILSTLAALSEAMISVRSRLRQDVLDPVQNSGA